MEISLQLAIIKITYLLDRYEYLNKLEYDKKATSFIQKNAKQH